MKARAASLLATFLIFLIVYIAVVSVSTTVFSLSPDNVCYEVWEGFNGDAVGNSYYDLTNGKFVMWINDTQALGGYPSFPAV